MNCMVDSKENFKFDLGVKRLTPYTLTSVCIFSILFSVHFLGADKENLVPNSQELLQLV